MSLPKIILDTDKTTPIYELPLKIRQGDTGDELQVTLGKSFQKYTDLSTVDVELIAKTPDQRLIKQAVSDKSGNTFKIKFPDEMYTNVGVFRNMYFKVGDDSTSDIKLVVLQGIGSIKEAGSYIDDFETLIEEAQSYVLALKDFSDTGNAKIDDKVAELTGKMTDFVDKSKEDLDAAKTAWSTFQSSSETAFTTAQDKRTSDFNSQKAGFETDFNEQKADFESRFKALLTTLQSDYDDFKALINKDVADFNKSLDNLGIRATGIENRYDAIKAQLDALKVPEIGGRNLLVTAGAEKDKMVSPEGTIEIYIGSSVMKDFIPVTSGEKLVFQRWGTQVTGGKAPDDLFRYAYYDLNRNLVERSVAGHEEVTRDTVPNNASLMRVSYPSNLQVKLERGTVPTDWTPAPEDVQTAITNALDKTAEVDSKLADYSTTAEVDSKISTGVGQAKTYAEQSIKDIIGAAPATLDTIAELADAVTKNKDGVQAINDGITKKADKTELANYESKAEVISQTDYEAKKTAGTLENKFYIVTDDTEAS
ncbi:phage tail protein [Companilactobacillus farciminis]|uniref:phage tail protein n=1 Tax=Companilactobacillus farciminis TaxID=1612 RepID=UPI00232D7036|nr:phage tail protein [Companilactobacillus farciminis]WCG36420.1 phage tail protein [Companilactobacillus farciminis]